jgi:hypothetical protein
MNTIITDPTNYLLDSKLITIHSNDRDQSKWPFASEFEIELPQEYYNIQTMRLMEITFSNVDYVISNFNKNTKLSFKIDKSDNKLFNESNPTDKLKNIYDNIYTIELDEGNYRGDQLANELQFKMNKIITDALNQTGETYLGFSIKYNNVDNKMYFGNNNHSFTILFDKEETYNLNCNVSDTNNRNINNYIKNLFNKPKKGLYYYLGFLPVSISSKCCRGPQVFGYLKTDNGAIWLNPKNEVCYVLKSLNQLQLYGESVFYMEIDKYNNCDELIEAPEFKYSSSFTHPNKSCFKNTYGGKVDSYFSKIVLYNKYQNENLLPTNENIHGKLHNTTKTYEPPIENIKKLKFRFRYHDGTHVNFRNNDLNFTIEINSIRNEINKISHIQKAVVGPR